MKWNNGAISKSEFMKINSFHFIVNEKLDSELVHEKNAPEIPRIYYNEGPKIEDTALLQQSRSTTQTMPSPITKGFKDGNPIRYISECVFQPVTKPVRYRETLLIKTDTNKMMYNEEVFYETKFYPSKWSETMFTRVKSGKPKRILTEAMFPIEQDYHYISFEKQQAAASACKLKN